MTRQQPSLPRPTSRRLAQLSAWEPAPSLYRASDERHDQPWWFASRDPDRPGRFDLQAPAGTCYWADDPVGALIERHLDPAVIDPLIDVTDLSRSRVWSCPPASGLRAADLTPRAAGTAKEVSTHTPYDAPGGPWDWVDAVANVGVWDAVVGWTRLDAAASRTVAVFARNDSHPHEQAGSAPGVPPGWSAPATAGSGTRWAHELGGYVARPPGQSAIEILD